MKKIPFLIIIPHGGIKLPEELRDYVQISDFDLIYESDAFANDIFNFEDEVFECIHTSISRLFIDLDRSILEIPPVHNDGVIKKFSNFGKPIFKDNSFPDEIAISAILQRYYLPFYETVQKIITSGKVKCIIDCHTMMPVAPPCAPDAGKPRPLLSVQNRVHNSKEFLQTAPKKMADEFLRILAHQFRQEEDTIADRFTLNTPLFKSNLLKTFGRTSIPMMRLSLSKALYFTDEFLDLNQMKVDASRIKSLQQKLIKSIILLYKRFFA